MRQQNLLVDGDEYTPAEIADLMADYDQTVQEDCPIKWISYAISRTTDFRMQTMSNMTLLFTLMNTASVINYRRDSRKNIIGMNVTF